MKIPNLPIEDEGRLNDARLRENFITRVFTYDRFRTLVESSPAPRDLMAFHGEHKYLLLAHAPALTQHLGVWWLRAPKRYQHGARVTKTR